MIESMYALREDRRKTLLKSEKRGEKRGERRGERRGEKIGIIKTAQNMFKENIDIGLIEKITGEYRYRLNRKNNRLK